MLLSKYPVLGAQLRAGGLCVDPPEGASRPSSGWRVKTQDTSCFALPHKLCVSCARSRGDLEAHYTCVFFTSSRRLSSLFQIRF